MALTADGQRLALALTEAFGTIATASRDLLDQSKTRAVRVATTPPDGRRSCRRSRAILYRGQARDLPWRFKGQSLGRRWDALGRANVDRRKRDRPKRGNRHPIPDQPIQSGGRAVRPRHHGAARPDCGPVGTRRQSHQTVRRRKLRHRLPHPHQTRNRVAHAGRFREMVKGGCQPLSHTAAIRKPYASHTSKTWKKREG